MFASYTGDEIRLSSDTPITSTEIVRDIAERISCAEETLLLVVEISLTARRATGLFVFLNNAASSFEIHNSRSGKKSAAPIAERKAAVMTIMKSEEITKQTIPATSMIMPIMQRGFDGR